MLYTEEQLKHLKGLSSEKVAELQKKEGFNELPQAKKRGFIGIVLEVMKEPMFLLLVVCGLLYLFLGDVQEALMLLGFVFVIIGITVYQEGKTEKALDALRDLSSPRALVIRDGEQKRIAGREVVRGDLILLTEGDRVPADGVLLWGLNLTVDESLLTGESVSVRKNSAEEESLTMGRPGGEGTPFVYSGTLVVAGQGLAVVRETGARTEMGKIGRALESVKPEETKLQKETGSIVKGIFIIAIVLCALVVVVYGLTRGNWLEGLLSGITLAMAMLPEEFPVVLTVFLALGAWRMSKKNVLTRKVAAVETLGSATVLCVDKTGTLTQNRMSIQKLSVDGKMYDIPAHKDRDLPEDYHRIVEYGILASKKDPFDPMEKALIQLGTHKLANTEHIHENWQLIREYPLSRELLALSHVWQSPDGNEYVISAKGAPEAVADLCHVTPERFAEIQKQTAEMADEGLRVLGVARASFHKKDELPPQQHDFTFEWIGLIGLADPIRDTVPPAIKECYQAGIRVVMITGDYPKTAQAIAKSIGLKNPELSITGPELEKMDPEELKRRVHDVNVFARVVPEQKLILVNALKATGEIVAMTGDGVNDAPALKSAHIGVAMGERGTDVAREASSLVLLDDDFNSIVQAVRMGRRIFDNLRKAMAYIISVHIPIAGISLIPVLFRWPDLVLFPAHIVFLELIIDPACSIVFEAEPEESDIMKRNPRPASEPLFGPKTLIFSTLQGLVSLAAVVTVYLLALKTGHPADEARSLTFATLIISNLFLILTNRSWSKSLFKTLRKPNQALIWVLIGATAFLLLVAFVPFLRGLFHFAAVNPLDYLMALAAGIISVFWFELVKWISRRVNPDLMCEKAAKNK